MTGPITFRPDLAYFRCCRFTNKPCYDKIFTRPLFTPQCQGQANSNTENIWAVLLEKRGLMHARKVSSQISLCISHRLFINDILRLYCIFPVRGVACYRKSILGGKCRHLLACADCKGLSWTLFTREVHLFYFHQIQLKFASRNSSSELMPLLQSLCFE